MRHLRFALLTAAVAASALAAQEPPGLSRAPLPRLVVVVSVDEMRGDFLVRFDAGGGLHRLRERGFSYLDAHQDHLPTDTGPGHAVLLTGAPPGINGITGNDFVAFAPGRVQGKRVYCVADPQTRIVGASGPVRPGMSPRYLDVTTIGDELERATGGAAKTVSIAYKDRAAILMGGHAADVVLWFDDRDGRWVTSSFFAEALPAWVERLDSGEAILSAAHGERKVPTIAQRVAATPAWTPLSGGSFPSPHPLAGPRDYTRSGLGSDALFDGAAAAVVALDLGRDDVPDLLTIGLSSTDWVGHAYGPDSPELRDAYARLDRALEAFLGFLDERVGVDRYVVALTSDHGIVPVPEPGGGRAGATTGRMDPAAVAKAVDAALDARFGPEDWILAYGDAGCARDVNLCETEPNLYLDPKAVAAAKTTMEAAGDAAAEAAMTVDGVYLALTRRRILEGKLPATPLSGLITNSCHPTRSGDVVVIRDPGWTLPVLGPDITGHGAPWSQETHVPLVLAGSGIRRGTSTARVSLEDLAPTLAQLLHVPYPSGCQGRPLSEALAAP